MTTNRTDTYQRELNNANLTTLADVLRAMKIGYQLSPIKVVVSGLTATQNVDVTAAAVKAAATITGISLESGENLPPIGQVVSLRVAASGTAGSLGTYGVSDAGGTAIVPPGGASAAMGVATLSDDGKTIGFPNTVTAFTLVYYPRPAVTMTSIFNTLG